jgi:asparagine synthetase B (glutamine-hydrolysing)
MLWLARDRFGGKPLFWYAADGTLAFASELKALAGMPDFPRDLDPAGVAEVVARGCVSHQRTIYRGVHQVGDRYGVRGDDGPRQRKAEHLTGHICSTAPGGYRRVGSWRGGSFRR